MDIAEHAESPPSDERSGALEEVEAEQPVEATQISRYAEPIDFADGWSGTLKCTGVVRPVAVEGGPGCGEQHALTMDDLYIIILFGLNGRIMDMACFQCAACGLQTSVGIAKNASGLPTKERWLTTHGEK